MKTTKSMIRCGGMLTILVLALGLTAEVANADFVFGTPTNLGPPVNSAYAERGPSISADGLQLYFQDWPNPRPGGYGNVDLWVATRETKDDPWGEPVNLGPTVNSSVGEVLPAISADGLTLYFNDYVASGPHRPGGFGMSDLWVTTRKTKHDLWTEPVNLGPTVNSSVADRAPSISADDLSLFFHSNRPGGSGGYDIWVTTRDTIDDDWGTPVNLGPIVNSSTNDYLPDISADGLWLFFNSSRPGGYGQDDLWVTTRDTIDDDWGTPVNLGPTVNSSASDNSPNISADGSTLFFSSTRPGGEGSEDIWQAPIIPIVDFNGDGIVNAADMFIMVDHWGENYSLCDIGPTPLGDGIVDVQDLIILAEHLFEDVKDPTLIAHWKLDEAEGDIAYDSIGVNDAVLTGVPSWQPEGGIVDGALQLDGIDDYISTDFVLDPADGAFSVFAWINGGTPGQVVISQTNSIFGSDSTWLGTDPSDGKLMTGLIPPPLGRSKPLPLESEFAITDGQWHHIGLVWDGSYRYLYADGVETAKDTTLAPYPLIASDGGLYIGAGKNLDAASFFSGLIDDVRIYNVALSAEKIEALAQ